MPSDARPHHAPPTDLSTAAAADPEADRDGSAGRAMIHVYVPADLHRQLTDLETDQGWSHAELVLTAIESTYDTLQFPADTTARNGGGLFTRSYRSRNPTPRDVVPMGVRLVRDDIDQINDLVSASTAASRSAYIVAALQAFLDISIPQEKTRD